MLAQRHACCMELHSTPEYTKLHPSLENEREQFPNFLPTNIWRQVKASPSCLGYDGSVFQATFEAFSEVFGEEETKGMVTRNPNLLAVKPTGFGGACNAKSDTMQMSYVIAATR